jgi:ABC-type multidrug transport system fused ATPase/permease subunit
MSSEPRPDTRPNEAFDDRVDISTDLTTRESATLLWRSLRLLKSVKVLFVCKAVLAIIAIIPGLYAPWLGKIVVDQVILQRPFNLTDAPLPVPENPEESLMEPEDSLIDPDDEGMAVAGNVPFPPHVMPLVNWLDGKAPMEIMLYVSAFLALMVVLLSSKGEGGGEGGGAYLVQGEDHATQSENQINQGGSQAGGVLGAIEGLVDIRLHQRLVNGFRTTLFQRLAHLPMKTLDDHRIGDSVYRVMHDAPSVNAICFSLTIAPIFMVLNLVIQMYLLNYSYGAVAPELIWIALALFPVSFLATFPLSRLMRRLHQKSRAAGSATTNAMEESMSNIRAVQSLGGMQYEKERFAQKSAESFRRYRHTVAAQIGLALTGSLLYRALALCITLFIVKQVIAGTMTPGDLAVLIGIGGAIGGVAMGFGMYWINLQTNVAAVRRAFFFVDFETEDKLENLPRLPDVGQGLRFENVGLTYTTGPPALRDVNLDMAVGELIALVGPTGAGKSSLAYLIPGFYRPTQGRVLVDGQDIAGVNVDSLRSQVTYVFQEHILLNESIRSNLLIANPKATEAAMLEACRNAGAMEFIDALSEGLDTQLGRSGDTLSVGQKQRLCIARGLVRNTKILILDEPTAALDPKTENALVRGLQRAARDRLVIVIAHRLSTIRRADRIIFLDAGQVMDAGDHESLMADRESPYRRFVELQGG